MLFNTWLFAGFFAAVFIIYWLLRTSRAQNIFLLVASLFFYGVGGVKFVGLILLCSTTAYIGGLFIERRPKQSRLTLVITAGVTLGTLFIFKYFNFFVETINENLSWSGIHLDGITTRLVLPIGISFFTFQALGYVVDVHRGKISAEKNAINFFLFVTFFPQLVAGPIERADHLLPQMSKRRTVNGNDLLSGIFLIIQGLTKKVVVADNIKPIVDSLFEYDNLSSPLIVAALIGFTFQIYCDFSGYSDIARGAARLLGFKLLLNFRRPYWSLSPTEFWQRWHITLSNWFRDYVYIALGGNRVGYSRLYFNLFATMTLSGLWHGASANFILWGAYHGGLLLIHRLIKPLLPQRPTFLPPWLANTLSRSFTFAFVAYGWLLFRITEWSQIKIYTISMVSNFSFASLGFLSLASLSIYVAIAIVIDIVESHVVNPSSDNARESFLVAPYLSILVILLLLLGSASGGEFIYFKF